MREKLIELLQHDNCPLFMVFGDKVDVLADYLIANGVTVQQWIPVAERLPEDGDRVIACGAKGGVFMIRATSIAGFGKVDGASSHRCYTHWMPLPEPSEGE